MMKMR